MAETEDTVEHQVGRYFVMGDKHVVQCDCGDKFTGPSSDAAMKAQFRHAWAKVNSGG